MFFSLCNQMSRLAAGWMLVLLVPQALLAQAPSDAETLFQWNLALALKLRDNRDFDTALLLLEKIARENPNKGPQLSFEQARILVDQAAIEPDPIYRERQRRQARKALENALAAVPGSTQAKEAGVWLARVDMQLARAMLARVLPLVPLPPDNAPAQGEKVKARTALAEAGARLERAISQAKAGGVDPRILSLLEKAELEVALSHFDRARTFNPQREADQRLDEVRKAQKLLTAIKDAGDANSVSSTASAWLGLLLRENGEPQKARAELKPLLVATGTDKAEAKRLARVFNMEVLLRDGFDPTERSARPPEQVVEELGFAWLSDYRRFSSMPEASAVRMLIAEAIVAQLRKMAKTPANQRQREDRYAQIRRLVRDIERGDNEYTEKARRLKIAIMQDQGAFTKKLEDLKTFDDCLARAQFELVKMGEEIAETKDPGARHEVERKRQELALEALRRGLKLNLTAPQKDKALPEELNQAKYTRVFLANSLGLHDEAIREGEEFSRNDPRPSQAIMSGAVALQSHLAVIEDARRKIAGLDGMEKGGQKVDAATRQAAKKSQEDATAAMVKFAGYLATRWPEEELANTCRMQLGQAAIRAGKTEEALKAFSEVRQDSRVRPLALMQAALIHYQLAEASSGDPNQKAGQVARAVSLLKQIPPQADVADKALTDNFLQSRLRLAGDYYTAKDFQALAIVLDELDSVRSKLDEDSVNAYGALFQRADLYSLLLANSRASALKDPGQQAEAFDVALKRLAKAKGTMNAKPTVNAFLERALQSALQAGRKDMAERVVATATQLAGMAPQEEDTQNLARMMLAITRRLLASPAPDQKEALATRLLETLDKVPEVMRSGATTRRMLAGAYEAVGLSQKDGAAAFKKGLALLEPVVQPLLADTASLAAAKEKQATVVNYLRLLRLDGQLELERALLTKATTTGGWGSRSLDVAMEDLNAMVAEKKFGLATRRAKPLFDQLESKVQQVGATPTPADRFYLERYTEVAALQVLAFAGYGRESKDAASTTRAAALLGDLEKRPWYPQASEYWRKKLVDMVEADPEFKAQLEKFRGGK